MIEDSMTRKINYNDTIGPLSSHGGLKNWDLFLSRESLIARPKGVWLSIKSGIYAGLGLKNAMNKVWVKTDTGEAILTDFGDSSWRRYPLIDLEFIEVKKCHSANEIRIKLKNVKTHVYGIGDRNQTNECRRILRDIYSEIYKETNF